MPINSPSSRQPTDAARTGGRTPRPGAEAPDVGLLLPQTLGGVFDEAFDLYKRHFSVIALIVAITYLPALIIAHGVQYAWLASLETRISGQSDDPAPTVLFGLGCLLFGIPKSNTTGLLGLSALVMGTGPVCLAVSNLYLGRAITAREAFRESRRAFGRLLGAWLLAGLASLFVGFVVMMLAGVSVGMAMSLRVFPETVSAVVLMLAITVLPYMAICAVVARSFVFNTQLVALENLPTSALTGRTSQLVGKSRFIRTWGAVMFLPLVTFGLESLIVLSLDQLVALAHLPPVVNFIGNVASATGMAVLFQPYWMIFLTLLYFDYRIRREGLDVRIMSIELPELRQMAPPPPGYGQTPYGPPTFAFPPPGLVPTPHAVIGAVDSAPYASPPSSPYQAPNAATPMAYPTVGPVGQPSNPHSIPAAAPPAYPPIDPAGTTTLGNPAGCVAPGMFNGAISPVAPRYAAGPTSAAPAADRAPYDSAPTSTESWALPVEPAVPDTGSAPTTSASETSPPESRS